MEGPIILQSSSSRWLAGLGLAILVLVGVSAAVALFDRRGEPRLLAEGTAEGSVQRYLLAIENGNDREAYQFLSAQHLDNCTLDRFRDSLRGIQPNGLRDSRRDQDLRVTLIEAKPVDDIVEVTARITRFRLDPPFGGHEYSHVERFDLRRIDGDWRFTNPPWPMYGCPDHDPAPAPPPKDVPRGE